jgi:hypothetical protein
MAYLMLAWMTEKWEQYKFVQSIQELCQQNIQ